MKKKWIAWLLVLGMVGSIVPGAAQPQPAQAAGADIGDWETNPPVTEGEWTTEDNYDISWYTNNPDATEFTLEDTKDLAGLAVLVNGKASDNSYEATLGDGTKPAQTSHDFNGKTIKLKENTTYDLSGKKWTTIAGPSGTFQGNFNGNGATITGMTIETESGTSGLFGDTFGSTIQNVTVTDSDIRVTNQNSQKGVGGIVGKLSSGTLINCHFSGNIYVKGGSDMFTGGIVGVTMSPTENSKIQGCSTENGSIISQTSYTGGIVGKNTTGYTITNCKNALSISEETYIPAYVGGIVGASEENVSGCTNEGNLEKKGDYPSVMLGGIAGSIQNAKVTNCANNGTLTSDKGSQTGGIVAGTPSLQEIKITITDCTNSATITGEFVGGILGSSNGISDTVTITGCKNLATVTSDGTSSSYASAGGIVGFIGSNEPILIINQCYNAGAVSAQKHAGGLIGLLNSGDTTITDCYNVGAVEAESASGGLIGKASDSAATVKLTSSYNAGTVSGNSNNIGGIVGLSSSQVDASGATYWDGCCASGTGQAKSVNAMTEDSSWQTNLGLSGDVWEKTNNADLTGYLPVLKANKQDPAPTLTRTPKQSQESPSITSPLENNQILEDGESFTLVAGGGSGTGAYSWAITSGGELASIDENGKVSLSGNGVGQVTVTLTKAGDNTYEAATTSYTFYIVSKPIETVTLTGLKAPVQGENPVMTITTPDGSHYEALTPIDMGTGTNNVLWKTADGGVVGRNDAFEKDKTYVAVIHLKADDQYSFVDADRLSVELPGLQKDAYTVAITPDKTYPNNRLVTVTFKATDHEHSYATEWTTDATHHWHACVNDGCPLSPSEMAGYGAHVDADDDKICDTCKKQVRYDITFDANGGSCDVTSLRSAIGGTLDSLPTPSRSGYTFTGWFTKASGGEQVTAATVFTVDQTVYAQWQSEAPSVITYPVKVSESENGSVSASRKSATAGRKVTLTVTPEDGYTLDTLTVTDRRGKTVTVTKNDDGTYTFKMPRSNVTVTATFVKIKEEGIHEDWRDCPKDEHCPLAAFSDTDPHAWYHDGVHEALVNGLLVGTSETTFAPNADTSRAMIVTMLHRLEGSPSVTDDRFSDVADSDWFAEPVAWAASEGIVSGMSATTFAPNDAITREQLAAILHNYAEYKGMDTRARADLSKYADADSVSTWAQDVFSWANAEGLINGMTDNTIDPQEHATRAQVAVIFQRFLDK